MPKINKPKPDTLNIHGSCVAIKGHGVLLLGTSGAGKSDIALMLIDGGARLVTDDRTILFVKNGALYAKAPASILGLLEIRGLGIVQMPVRRDVRIRLAVKLGKEGARLPQPQVYRQLNCAVPQIAMDGRIASTPARIRAALTAIIHKRFIDTFHVK